MAHVAGTTIQMFVPVRLRNGDRTVETYAMFDSAATKCAILPSIAEKLELEIHNSCLNMCIFDRWITEYKDQADVEVESLETDCIVKVKRAILSDIFATEQDKPPRNADIEDLDYMEGTVSFLELEDETIGLIFSSRYAYHFWGGEVAKRRPDEPIAVNTPFGWTILGCCGESEEESRGEVGMNCCAVETDLDPVMKEVNRMWRHDFLIRDGEKASPDEVHPSREDQEAVSQIKDTLVFDKELGHYRVGLPWLNGREAAAQLLDNEAFEAHAKKRMVNTRNRMMKDPPRREGVTAAIKKIIDEGHARRVTNPKVGPGIPVCTLPIHVVAQKGKFRVCQDGAAKVKGVCLNDALSTGPDLMNRLPGVIMRFRQNQVAISADIKGFFHQIYLDENDSRIQILVV